MSRPPLQAIGIVVPVHDEGALLESCLTALTVAVDATDLPVDLVAVLDACTDDSAKICADLGVRSVSVAVRNVGMARAIGVAALPCGWQRPEALWLAGTDADTVVPPDWLTRQVALADAGADLVLGVVEIGDQELTPAAAARYDQLYSVDASTLTHPHVHGANLGVRASAYRRAGGYPPLANHEDHGLVDALLGHPDLTVVRTSALRVRTSGRLVGRCREGFAAHLSSLAAAV